MAKIHGFMYILIGLFVSIMSWKLNNQKIFFFFFVGLIFVFVGVVKLIINFIKNKKNKTKNAQTNIHNQQHLKSQMHQRFKYCQKCRNAIKINDRFCGRCGTKL